MQSNDTTTSPPVRTMGTQEQQTKPDGLASTLPWHVGFHNDIADNLHEGNWQHGMVRYKVVNVCANNGRHVAWACSAEHAALIVEAVNKMDNTERRGAERPAGAQSSTGERR